MLQQSKRELSVEKKLSLCIPSHYPSVLWAKQFLQRCWESRSHVHWGEHRACGLSPEAICASGSGSTFLPLLSFGTNEQT